MGDNRMNLDTYILTMGEEPTLHESVKSAKEFSRKYHVDVPWKLRCELGYAEESGLWNKFGTIHCLEWDDKETIGSTFLIKRLGVEELKTRNLNNLEYILKIAKRRARKFTHMPSSEDYNAEIKAYEYREYVNDIRDVMEEKQ